MDSFADKVIITFHSHYDAVRQKKKLTASAVSCELIPVPRFLSSSCGTALMLDGRDYDAALLIDEAESVNIYQEGRWSDLRQQ